MPLMKNIDQEPIGAIHDEAVWRKNNNEISRSTRKVQHVGRTLIPLDTQTNLPKPPRVHPESIDKEYEKATTLAYRNMCEVLQEQGLLHEEA